MALTLRPITPSDQESWRRLWRGYLDFYQTAVSDAVYRTTFSRLTSGLEGEFSGLMAWREGEAVGLVHFLSHRHCWREENVVYLQDLYVVPVERGKGTGRTLIEAVYKLGDDAGTPVVYWMTQQDNAPARKLYDQVATFSGFIRYQR